MSASPNQAAGPAAQLEADGRVRPLVRPARIRVGLAACEHAQPAFAYGAAAGAGSARRGRPGGGPGSVGMLHDYITPGREARRLPEPGRRLRLRGRRRGRRAVVVQVPDFGGRFWVYQVVDQRTDSFAQLGTMYGTKPGLYLLAPTGWDGDVPDGIAGGLSVRHPDRGLHPAGVHGRHGRGSGRHPARSSPR